MTKMTIACVLQASDHTLHETVISVHSVRDQIIFQILIHLYFCLQSNVFSYLDKAVLCRVQTGGVNTFYSVHAHFIVLCPSLLDIQFW